MLNEEQLAAVQHEGANLLIVAGPGTGKTATIAQRTGGAWPGSRTVTSSVWQDA